VKCWGLNSVGQLGLENTMNRGDNPGELLNQPPVRFGTGRVARAVRAGQEHCCVLMDDDSVKCWGRNLAGALGNFGPDRGGALGTMGDAIPVVELGTGRTAKMLSSGGQFTCAVLDNDALKCWGYNSVGQLGLGDTAQRGAPAQMGDNLPALDLGSGHSARAVSAGAYHACAIRDDGALYCWGAGADGKTGLGDGTIRLVPAPVELGTGRRVKAIAAAHNHTCAILDNDSLKCWGYNAWGQLGLGDITSHGNDPQEMGDYLPAVNLGSGRTAKAVALGDVHTCAILDDDSVKCWGRNPDGQLGLGDQVSRGFGAGQMGDALPRVNLGTGRTAKAIAAGSGLTCALLDNDAVKCWGRNFFGQLGLGDTATRGTQASQMGDGLPALNFGW
jgi:E3 ubiquitin-protein ligase HERC3